MKKITHLVLALPQAFGVWWRQLKAYQKVLVMIVSFVILIVCLQLLLGTAPNQTKMTSTSPAPEPTLALPPERVLRQLPYEEEGFVVAYNEPTQEYLITVTAPPYEAQITKAYAWLAKQRITPENQAIRETWSRFKEYK